jgi:hypothetical protein
VVAGIVRVPGEHRYSSAGNDARRLDNECCGGVGDIIQIQSEDWEYVIAQVSLAHGLGRKPCARVVMYKCLRHLVYASELGMSVHGI